MKAKNVLWHHIQSMTGMWDGSEKGRFFEQVSPGDNFIRIFMDAVGKVVLSDRDINIVVLDGELIFHHCSYKAHWNVYCGKHSVDALFWILLNCQPKDSLSKHFCYNQDDLVKCSHCAV